MAKAATAPLFAKSNEHSVLAARLSHPVTAARLCNVLRPMAASVISLPSASHFNCPHDRSGKFIWHVL